MKASFFVVRFCVGWVIIVCGPYVAWNYVLTYFVAVPQVDVLTAFGIAITLKAPIVLWRTIQRIPGWVRKHIADYREHQRKQEDLRKIRKLIAQGRVAEAIAYIEKLRQVHLIVKLELAKRLVDDEMKEYSTALVA